MKCDYSMTLSKKLEENSMNYQISWNVGEIGPTKFPNSLNQKSPRRNENQPPLLGLCNYCYVMFQFTLRHTFWSLGMHLFYISL